MAINSFEVTKRFTENLDKKFVQKSVTSFLEDNALRTKFVGTKQVSIPDVAFAGLVNYDKDTGFARGAITVEDKVFQLSMDRARSLSLDRMDDDESGVAGLAGKILGEYVRTKVVPECDAYVLSKLFSFASAASNTEVYIAGKEYEQFKNLEVKVRDKVGYDEELVAFVHSDFYAALSNSPEISRYITVSDFKKGEINTTVKSLNGIALIPVTSERMKSAYTFETSGVGGFSPNGGAKAIELMIMPKSGAHLVKKTEKMRVFTPDQNLDADAYKFDYRVYYDVFVKKSEEESIQALYAE